MFPTESKQGLVLNCKQKDLKHDKTLIMFRCCPNRAGLGLKARVAVNGKRFIITGPTRTGSGANLHKKVTKTTAAGDSKSSSGSWTSIFDASFVFNLFLVVGAMGAGYTLGKTTVLTSPPATLFPARSTTPYELLVEYEKEDKEREGKQYDMFRRCILRILESKGIEVDTKHGKNEFLYEQTYCSGDISGVMNDEDNLGDVFFGRDPKEWAGKRFVWYPESTEDVATIMKYCDEFKVPVTTVTSQVDPSGLTFQIDLRRFKGSGYVEGGNEIEFALNVPVDEMNRTLQEHGFGGLSYGELTPAELFFVHSGVKLPSTDGLFVGGKVPAAAIDGLECVLPDGEVLALHNDPCLPDEHKLFQLLVPFQEQLCVVTKVLFAKDKSAARASSSAVALAVVASNELDKLNAAIGEIRKRVAPGRAIALVDSTGCDRITATYGPYRTFAAVKVDAKELGKLQKKFGGDASSAIQFHRIDLATLGSGTVAADDAPGCYFSDRVASSAEDSLHVLLVRDDLNADADAAVRTYHQTTPAAETAAVDTAATPSSSRNLVRKLKLAVDSHRVLNRNVAVAVAVAVAESGPE